MYKRAFCVDSCGPEFTVTTTGTALVLELYTYSTEMKPNNNCFGEAEAGKSRAHQKYCVDPVTHRE